MEISKSQFKSKLKCVSNDELYEVFTGHGEKLSKYLMIKIRYAINIENTRGRRDENRINTAEEILFRNSTGEIDILEFIYKELQRIRNL